MGKLFLTLFFVISTSLSAQTYVYSYLLTIDKQGKATEVRDSCVRVETWPSISHKPFIIEYQGNTYYFKVLKMREENTSRYYHLHQSSTLYGVADCLGSPYSLRQDFKGNIFTLWILPMRFNTRSTINHKRAFIFTDDKVVIKTLPGYHD